MNSHIANPRALGFGVLGIALWMFSVKFAGIGGGSYVAAGLSPQVWRFVQAVVWMGLLIAGIAAFLRREGWLGFYFLLWAGFAWAGLHVAHVAGYAMPLRYFGWFLMTIALVNFYLWLAAGKSRMLGSAVSLQVFLLWLAFLCFGLIGFFGFGVLYRIGGAIGLASALVAFYISFGALVTEHNPEKRLPGIVRTDETRPRDGGI